MEQLPNHVVTIYMTLNGGACNISIVKSGHQDTVPLGACTGEVTSGECSEVHDTTSICRNGTLYMLPMSHSLPNFRQIMIA